MSRRDCAEVITQMLDKIPDVRSEFIARLKANREDAVYKPPEEVIQWQRTQQTLQDEISKPTEDWEFEVLSIFTTKSVEELRSMFKGS
jgi:hypothetical protein